MTVTILGLTQAALAQNGVDSPSLVFQLEGNVTDDASICFLLNSNGAFTAAPPCSAGFTLVTFAANTDDWQNIASPPNHASATSFIGPNTSPAEAINSTSDSIFTGGGSKDILGISTGAWAWKNGKPQGKDDIEHAFAAAYTLPGTVNGAPQACGGTSQPGCDTAIYFGMTRFDNSGDATAGFWFFQDGNVKLAGGTLNANKDPICSVGSGCPFAGHHSNGDLLIVSDFSQGGPITSIQAFEWQCSGTGATCDSSGSLVAVTQQLTNLTCNPTSGTSNFCSIANGTAGLTVPFGFLNKSGQNTLDHGELLEGGINLNVIFPNGLPCFSTFMAETRSSNSPTATLSDLTPPVSFPLCGASITKTCNSASFVNGTNGTTVQYNFSGTIKNTGIGNLTNVVVSDTPGGTFISGTLTLNQPDLSGSGGVLAPGATVNYSGSFQASTVSSTIPNTATVNATSTGGTAISPASASWIVPPATTLPASCVPAPGPLAITKECTVAVVTVGSVLEIRVDFDGTITNNSGVQVTGLQVTDNPSTAITLGTTTLNNGGSTTYSGSYFPSTCSTTDGGRCAFTDTVSASGSGGAGTGTITSNLGSATCHLCPPGACSTSP